MPAIETPDLLIAGAGPAGLSAALHLVRADRRWAERMVVVERATHPRDKLCGGGVTRTGEEELAGWGWAGAVRGGGGEGAPPNVPIAELRLAFGERAWAARAEPIFRVTRRREARLVAPPRRRARGGGGAPGRVGHVARGRERRRAGAD